MLSDRWITLEIWGGCERRATACRLECDAGTLWGRCDSGVFGFRLKLRREAEVAPRGPVSSVLGSAHAGVLSVDHAQDRVSRSTMVVIQGS